MSVFQTFKVIDHLSDIMIYYAINLVNFYSRQKFKFDCGTPKVVCRGVVQLEGLILGSPW